MECIVCLDSVWSCLRIRVSTEREWLFKPPRDAKCEDVCLLSSSGTDPSGSSVATRAVKDGSVLAFDQENIYVGSGFKSNRPYRNGYFGASIKLQGGYTAGVNTAFYLSNNQAHPGFHDEVDIEFLGTTPGKPYTLQTNVYVRGSGDGRIIGREMRFHLWFDPTADFHHYAILWNPDEIM
ncbi:hypothetical protein B296_00048240 [Ensete ventricosum]|uniref:GH16 domain-containing protein n=1 Tax=Ensete ventricosum TaxID=4639 RepID=A0A426XPV5_ENSVE|nr:hypothetical protein B296_00048240 [Ensete ventricosum]